MSIAGKRFVLAGRLSDFTHAQLEERLESMGASVTSSVSGVTDYVVAGSNPGSKLDDALEYDTTVIDEEQLIALMEGLPAAEVVDDEAVEDATYPQINEHLRNGTYRSFYDDGKQIELEGDLRDGVRIGTWRGYYQSGQLHWEIEYVDGFEEGRETGWHENGEKRCEGNNASHQRTGSWTYWYDDGAFEQAYFYDEDAQKHGEYVWDKPDGSPRGRGGFWHGKRHGEWTWWDTKTHSKAVRGYHRGTNHGEDAGWYPNGELAYRRHYSQGTKSGEEVEFYEDTSPKLEVTWEQGHVVGEKHTWDEAGNETVEVFVDGLPQALAEDIALMEKTAKKLARAKDKYAKDDVLRDAAGRGNEARFLVRMVRKGVFDVAAHRQLWDRYTSAHALIEAEEVIDLLKRAECVHSSYVGHIPGWPRAFDELTMRVYSQDPEPFAAAIDELPAPMKRGVALVMARFGDDISGVIDDPVRTVAEYHCDHGISSKMWWPGEDGIERVELLDGTTPNANFVRFIELFTTQERWAEVLLGCALKEAGKLNARVRFPRVKHAIEAAGADQMPELLAGISLDGFSIKYTRQALFDWRDDDAASIAKMALAIDDYGLSKWPTVACAIIKLSEEGKPIPQELVDALELYSGHQSLSWVDTEISRLDDDHQKSLAMINQHISFAEPGFGFSKIDLVFEALAAVSEDQRRELIERRLEKGHSQSSVAPYLHLIDDMELWRRAIQAILEDTYGASDKVAFGLAHLPMRALPLLEAARQEASRQDMKKTFQRAIIGLLASASDRGEAGRGEAGRGEIWEEEWDELICFDAAPKKYKYSDLRPLLMKVVYNLPRERAQRVLRRGLGRSSTFARAFRFIGAHPIQELAEYAFTQLLERESSLSRDDVREIQAGLEYFPNVRPWVKWLLRNGAGSHLKSQFEAAAGCDTFAGAQAHSARIRGSVALAPRN